MGSGGGGENSPVEAGSLLTIYLFLITANFFSVATQNIQESEGNLPTVLLLNQFFIITGAGKKCPWLFLSFRFW